MALIMNKLIIAALFILCFTANAWCATYYVCNDGDDANNGTATGTPWEHSPDMADYTGAGSLANGDTIDLFIENTTDETDFTVIDLNCVIN